MENLKFALRVDIKPSIGLFLCQQNRLLHNDFNAHHRLPRIFPSVISSSANLPAQTLRYIGTLNADYRAISTATLNNLGNHIPNTIIFSWMAAHALVLQAFAFQLPNRSLKKMRTTMASMKIQFKQILILMALGVVLLATPPPANANTEKSDYAIGPNDVLQISVYGYPELSSEVRVSDSGKITFPLIGGINVNAKSTRHVEQDLEAALRKGNFIKQPHVSVRVEKYQSQVVAVMGCVTKPGQYPLEKASNVIDMLAIAGGIDRDAAGEKIVLLHRDGSKTELDLEAIFLGEQNQNPQVHDGDTLYVAKADMFYIYGEVRNPGAYKLERGMTISQAIAAGGGLTNRGTERKPRIKRMGPDKKETEIVAQPSDFIQPKDTLYINESWF